jgi:hypothetical protein
MTVAYVILIAVSSPSQRATDKFAESSEQPDRDGEYVKIDKKVPTDWRDLSEFRGVDLNRSFVLSWHIESETLMVDVDLYLTAEHPSYEKPRPAEKVCIRSAIIEFPYCDQITADTGTSSSMADLVESLGHGAIEGVQRHDDGRYEINGEFGKVFVAAERPVIRLMGP